MATGGYPPGAEYDPNAPYNQDPYEKEPRDVDILISTTLSKSTTISTEDYEVEAWEDAERDEDGYLVRSGGTDYQYTALEDNYTTEEYTIPELLDILYDEANRKLKEENLSTEDKVKWTTVLNSCEGWNEDELEVMEE